MNIIAVGLNHKTAPVEIREQVAFSADSLVCPLERLIRLPEVVEGLILSTCNRVELYATGLDAAAAVARIKNFLADFHQVPVATLTPHFYEYRGEAAIRHLFRVAASLDSMVIGEPQILGQLKEAFLSAQACQSAGLILTRLLHKSFSVAKRVRTETDIACQAVSISYSAVELARKIFGDLRSRSVLILGAGEMCELAARHLVQHQVAGVVVANRTYSRAVELAERFGGRAVQLDDIDDQLQQADIVLASTGAGEHLLTRSRVEEVIRRRKNRPMFFIDIAVPRNIDPEINEIDNVYLYDIDDLQSVIEANLKERRKAAEKAEIIIDQEIVRFQAWLAGLEIAPTIAALRHRLEDIRRGELEKTLAQLKDLGPREREAIDSLTAAIVKKILHQPITVLKKSQNDMEGEQYLEAVRKLFDLDLPPNGNGE
ncbi:MAG: glutamyl-tRNA reductase [Syntrophotaleaceae bacterium]